MKNEHGQVLLILILVMTVALAIAISVIQRSLSDISTSTKVEESSRAFSAAEAGIEKALTCATPSCAGSTIVSFTENQSSANIPDSGWGPAVPTAGNQQAALEYPPLSKEEVVQVWLAEPESSTNPPAEFYRQNRLDVYWGGINAPDKAALELTLVYWDGSKYVNRKWYLDPDLNRSNNFEKVNCSGSYSLAGYQCKRTIGATPDTVVLQTGLMLLRARLLYNTTPQHFAVQASVTCPGAPCQNYSLPPQIRTLISTGTAGGTQRTIKVFQTKKFVPFLDFAIFSAGDINK